MEKCPIYDEGRAKEEYFLDGKKVICSLEAIECPYNKGITINYELDPVTVCRSNGLLKPEELEEGSRGLVGIMGLEKSKLSN